MNRSHPIFSFWDSSIINFGRIYLEWCVDVGAQTLIAMTTITESCPVTHWGVTLGFFALSCAYVLGFRQVFIATGTGDDEIEPILPATVLSMLTTIFAFLVIPALSRRNRAAALLASVGALTLLAYTLAADKTEFPVENLATDERLGFGAAIAALFIAGAIWLAPKFPASSGGLRYTFLVLFLAGIIILFYNSVRDAISAAASKGDKRGSKEVQREFSYYMIPLSLLLLIAVQVDTLGHCSENRLVPMVVVSVISFFSFMKNVYSTLRAEYTAQS